MSRPANEIGQARQSSLSRRHLIKIGAGSAAAATVAALALKGGRTGSPPPARRRATLRLGIQRPPIEVDPLTLIGKSGGYVLRPVLPTLFSIRLDGTVRPVNARSITGNATATQWTLKLRPGRWSGGLNFDSRDIVSSLDYILDPAGSTWVSAGFRGILSYRKYRAVDAETVIFDLDRPYVDFPFVLAYAATAWLPRGYRKGGFAKGRAGGLGPFLLKSYEVDRGATYVKNPDYFDAENIHIEALEYVFFDDDQSMVLALEGDQVDALPLVGASSALALRGNRDIEILTARSGAYTSVRMLTDSGPFADKRARQALAHAIDRQSVVDILSNGVADIGNDHVFAPVFPQSREVINAIPQRRLDIPRARALLAAAGYPNGMRLTIVSEQYADLPQYVQLVQSQAAAAGFTVDLKLLPQNAYYGSGLNRPWLNAMVAATDWAERATPSQMMAATYRTGALFNESRFSNARFDAAVTAFDGEVDPAARARHAIEAASIMHEEVPTIIGYFPRTHRLIRRRVRNMPAGPASAIDLTGVWIA